MEFASNLNDNRCGLDIGGSARIVSAGHERVASAPADVIRGSMAGTPGRFSVKVYYEDTDSLSVVYYANYLKYLERGRTEFFANAGFAPWTLNEQGIIVAVHRADLTFLAPARLGDTCEVVTSVAKHTSHRVILDQSVTRGETQSIKAQITLVFLNRDLQLRETPADIAAWLEETWPNP
jgi:tol-pal system-associated acyl-CoA thioesterase